MTPNNAEVETLQLKIRELENLVKLRTDRLTFINERLGIAVKSRDQWSMTALGMAVGLFIWAMGRFVYKFIS